MSKVGYAILVVFLPLILLCQGCRRSVHPPAREAAPRVRVAPTWGPEIQGLQCRLRPVKRLWSVDTSPAFKVDLRNQGKRLFAFDATEPIQADRILLDGQWYRWPPARTASARIQRFAPGVELADLNLILPRTPWLDLTPGYHEIAVAFVFEGIEVVSNRVDIIIAN